MKKIKITLSEVKNASKNGKAVFMRENTKIEFKDNKVYLINNQDPKIQIINNRIVRCIPLLDLEIRANISISPDFFIKRKAKECGLKGILIYRSDKYYF